jgi:hypothetical protein
VKLHQGTYNSGSGFTRPQSTGQRDTTSAKNDAAAGPSRRAFLWIEFRYYVGHAINAAIALLTPGGRGR